MRLLRFSIIGAAAALLSLSSPAFAQQAYRLGSAGARDITSASPLPTRKASVATVATITRPADTDAYASGDLLANSVTAGSVVASEFVAARSPASTGVIESVRVTKTGTSVTNAAVRVHFFTTVPVPVNGDNAAFSTTGAAGYVGYADVTIGQAFTDGASGISAPTLISMPYKTGAASLKLYALVEARGVYTPASAEVFTVTANLAY